jgi:hypothetical protein
MYLKSLQSRWPCPGANSPVLWPGPLACFSARASCRPPVPTSAPTQVPFRAASPLLAISTTGSRWGIPCLAPSILDKEGPSTITDFNRHLGLADGVGMGTCTDKVQRSSRHPGDVRHEMIVVLCTSYLLRLMLLRRLLPSPRWLIQSSCPNRSPALPATLHLPLQIRFLVRPQLLTRPYPLPMGRDIPRSLLLA